MSKYTAENERVKQDYVVHLRLAKGKPEPAIDSALKAIEPLESFTEFCSFEAFNSEQAEAFSKKLFDQSLACGEDRLSAAAVASTLRDVRLFFTWLAKQPGCELRVNFGRRGDKKAAPSSSARH
jgi:hypothetical protein